MKVDDKLLCKRDNSNNSKHVRYNFIRNKYYKITRIETCSDMSYVSLKNEKGYEKVFNVATQFGPKIERRKNLNRFFYTPKEIRKLKLKRLMSGTSG